MDMNDELKEWIQIRFDRIMARFDRIERYLEKMTIKENLLQDEYLLDNQNVSQPHFSTSHDYKVAKIIVNYLIQFLIEIQLNNKDQEDKLTIPKKLNWTSSKVALIELIYSLHYQGVFNNGNSDIGLIAKYFENVFDINLGNFYQTYLELRNRKMNPTKFLDALREGLIRKMNEQDEK